MRQPDSSGNSNRVEKPFLQSLTETSQIISIVCCMRMNPSTKSRFVFHFLISKLFIIISILTLPHATRNSQNILSMEKRNHWPTYNSPIKYAINNISTYIGSWPKQKIVYSSEFRFRFNFSFNCVFNSIYYMCMQILNLVYRSLHGKHQIFNLN